MLPKTTGIVVPVSLKEKERPSWTYGMDLEGKRFSGMVDGVDAVRQAVYCILNTERYDLLIYSWNYGAELKDLYGHPMPYVKSELKRRIREALMQDDRIHSVDSFLFAHEQGKLAVSFKVHSVFGEFDAKKEVGI